MDPLRPKTSITYIQILSDLHLEIGQQYASYTFAVTAPLLLLAGDVGRLIDYEGYRQFLAAQAARYRQVFLVLGNHEFYGLSYEEGIEQACRLVADPSLMSEDNNNNNKRRPVVLLHRTRWDDPDPESDLTILGCTLWSAIPQEIWDQMAQSKIGDYRKIHGWTPEKHDRLHSEEVAWLREQTETARKSRKRRRLLIATHHAPCIEGTSRPELAHSPLTAAFATDLLTGDRDWDGVRTWVFGHTHYSTAFVREGIQVVANQRGYVLPGVVRRDQFDAGKVVRV